MFGSTALTIFTVALSTVNLVMSSLSTDDAIVGLGTSRGFLDDEGGVRHSFDRVVRIRREINNGSCFR